MTDNEKTIAWQNDVMTASRQISAAEIELRDAVATRLERKHRLEECRNHLLKLCEAGPFGSKGKQPGLFDNIEDEDDEASEDDIENFAVTKRVIGAISKAGVRTISRLRVICQGIDPAFPDGLDSIEGLSDDDRAKVRAEFDIDDGESSTVPFTPKVTEVPSAKPAVSSENLVMIELTEAVAGLGGLVYQPGTRFSAQVMPSGQALIVLEGDVEILVDREEYFTTEPVAAV